MPSLWNLCIWCTGQWSVSLFWTFFVQNYGCLYESVFKRKLKHFVILLFNFKRNSRTGYVYMFQILNLDKKYWYTLTTHFAVPNLPNFDYFIIEISFSVPNYLQFFSKCFYLKSAFLQCIRPFNYVWCV